LTPDYDIIQAIHTLIDQLPIPVNIFHVKSHQDRHKTYDELTFDAQINVLANQHADTVHMTPPYRTGLFPTWIPGTRATLFHNNQQIMSNIPEYIQLACHTPPMKEYLIQHSHDATGRDSSWDDNTYDSIAWHPLGEAFQKLTTGQCVQLSKYMNDILPTLCCLQTFDNKTNGHCFDCGQLWEDTNHVL
jgi:hypothetical protein